MANNPYSFKTYQSKKGQARKIIEKAEKKSAGPDSPAPLKIVLFSCIPRA
jgi:hypothetical protein